MRVAFRNTATGEKKDVKVGWSWTLFLFAGVFGLPLFLRRLYNWGFVFLALWVVRLIAPSLAGDYGEGISAAMFFLCLGLEIWLGVKGNEMTAKNYLEHGWRFADPQSDDTKFACRKWGILLDQVDAISA